MRFEINVSQTWTIISLKKVSKKFAEIFKGEFSGYLGVSELKKHKIDENFEFYSNSRQFTHPLPF